MKHPLDVEGLQTFTAAENLPLEDFEQVKHL